MKRSIPGRPVQALQVIDQNRSFHLINRDWESERVWLSVARQRTDYNQMARTIVGLIG
jgi:hypothetical protein